MTSSPVRVLYLTHTLGVGGAEELILNMVTRLPRDRYEPIVCCFENPPGPIGPEIAAHGVRVIPLGVVPGWRSPVAWWSIVRQLRRLRPRIVHTFMLPASLYGRSAAILARVPVIVGTEVNIYERKRYAHALAERVLMAGTDRVVVSAESVRDFYVTQVHADPAKIDVIYNAVDFTQGQPTMSRAEMRASLGVPAGARVAGIIARLTEQKGHRYLFEALASQPSLADVHLLVIGGGEQHEALVRDVDQKGLSSRVHFLGPRRDLGNLLAAMDVFVMASLWEGLPLSMVLAMGAGVPVVATRVAGIPEVVADGRTGLLVPPRDSNALGAALARLLGDPDLRRQFGDEARAAVLPRFGVDRYVESVASLYDRLLLQESA